MSASKLFHTLFLLCIIFQNAQAQQNNDTLKDSRYYSVSGIYEKGKVFPTNNFVSGQNAALDSIDEYQTMAIQFEKQTTGKALWEQLYLYPRYGAGIYIPFFENRKELGIPVALYGFFSAPFVRWQHLSFNYKLALGLAYGWKHFGPDNMYNIAIGSSFSAYINAGIQFNFPLFKTFDLAAGIALSHFSNGALKKPNFGLNTIAPGLSLHYRFKAESPAFIVQSVPGFKAYNEWHFSAYGGAKNVLFDTSNINLKQKFSGLYFPELGISSTFSRAVSFKSKIGFGLMLAYDGAIDAQIEIENGGIETIETPFYTKLSISIYPSYELLVNKLSIIVQPGIYLLRKQFATQSPVFYQRIGLHYNIYKNINLGINLHAYQFHVSDFIEWSLGYTLQ